MTAGQRKLEADLRDGVPVREALLRRSIDDLGPYVDYPDGTVTDRRTGEVLWRPGDSSKKPRNPERGKSNKPHTPRRF